MIGSVLAKKEKKEKKKKRNSVFERFGGYQPTPRHYHQGGITDSTAQMASRHRDVPGKGGVPGKGDDQVGFGVIWGDLG